MTEWMASVCGSEVDDALIALQTVAANFSKRRGGNGPRWEPHQASLSHLASHRLMEGDACRQVRRTKLPLATKVCKAATRWQNSAFFFCLLFASHERIFCVCSRMGKREAAHVPHGRSFNDWICRGCDASTGHRECSSASFFFPPLCFAFSSAAQRSAARGPLSFG